MNNKKEKLIFALLMALGMSFFMSLTMVIKNVGINPQFFIILLKEWGFSFLVSILPSIFLPVLINKLLGKNNK